MAYAIRISQIFELTNRRNGFTPHNSLASTNPPTFKKRGLQSTTTRPDQQHNFQSNWQPKSPFLGLPSLRQYDSPESASKNLSDIGDSSSLFSYNTSPSFDFESRDTAQQNRPPIPHIFGVPRKDPNQKIQMVNERSPAKAPLRPDSTHEKPPPKNPFANMAEPRFGEISMPQSPLHRKPAKESSVFLQPKSRPEHHREPDRSCMCLILILLKGSG